MNNLMPMDSTMKMKHTFLERYKVPKFIQEEIVVLCL